VSTGFERSRRRTAGAYHSTPHRATRAGGTDNAVDGQRCRPARSLAWPCARARAAVRGCESAVAPRWLHVLEQRRDESPPFSRLTPGDTARGVGPHPRPTRLRAQAGPAPPRRNGDSEPTGRLAGERMRPATGGSTPGRRVTTAVNQTAGSGGRLNFCSLWVRALCFYLS
jgi:hypothetical protein